jgi:hypothetical protein
MVFLQVLLYSTCEIEQRENKIMISPVEVVICGLSRMIINKK